jgi:hypothetical protein
MYLQDTILEQNLHWQGKAREKYVHRKILDSIKLESKFIEVLTGVRRSGKSTCFFILIQDLIKNGRAKPEEILFLNFDHPAFVPYYESPERLDEILDQAQRAAGRKTKYLFLDEVQNIRMWEKWVKAKYDAGTFTKIFITGSNADLLESQFTTRLSGRYFSHINYPFSFAEFLASRGQKYYTNHAKNHPIRYKLIGHFDDYLRLGGFPEVTLTGDKDILADYYQTILLKDVVASNEIRDIYGLRQVAYYLISNVSKLISYNRVGGALDIHEQTVKDYMEYLKSAFLFDAVRKFDYSVRKQARNPRKIYCVDNGLMNGVGFSFSVNSGRYLENLVYLEIKRRFKRIFYHTNGHECDFVAGNQDKQGAVKIEQAIQVCYNLNQDNREREFAGLLDAMEEHKLREGLVLTHNQADELKQNGKTIKVLPVWRWMLED